MTVVLVSDCETGGVAHHIRMLGQAFAELGFKVLLLYPSATPVMPLKIRDLEYATISSWHIQGLRAISYARNVNRYCSNYARKEEIEAIQYSNLSGFLHPLLKKKAAIPAIVKFHSFLASPKNLGYDSFVSFSTILFKNIMEKEVTKMACSYVPQIIAISRFIKNELKMIGIDEKKISVIYHGVSHEQFNPNINGESVKQKFGNPKNVVLYVGSFSYLKGVYHLISAIRKVVREFTEVLFVFVGGYDAVEIRNLRRVVEHCGLGKYVKVVGFINNSELPEYYVASDICVIPSLYEGLGNVALEAMASGKPVIASRIGGLSEIVNEKVGILIEPADIVSLANSILTLLTNNQLRPEMGKRAFEYSKHFSWEKTATETIRVWKEQKQS